MPQALQLQIIHLWISKLLYFIFVCISIVKLIPQQLIFARLELILVKKTKLTPFAMILFLWNHFCNKPKHTDSTTTRTCAARSRRVSLQLSKLLQNSSRCHFRSSETLANCQVGNSDVERVKINQCNLCLDIPTCVQYNLYIEGGDEDGRKLMG